MKLLVGLWNPGVEYERTRHNAGFMFLDYYLKEKWWWCFRDENKFFGKVFILDDLILLKPTTFMNLSWKSVLSVMKYYKLNLEDLIIVYDDKDMDFWKVRVREEWSSGGHNWIKDIIQVLWTQTFKRIKIGIDNPKSKYYDPSDFVLSRFSEEELNKLDEEVFAKVIDLI